MPKSWQGGFLEALRNSGNVRAAATVVGIERSTAYRARKRSVRFARQWDEALEDAADVLLAEARRRALKGIEEPVFYGGKLVGTRHRYSDALLMFLINRAHPQKKAESGSETVIGADPLQSGGSFNYAALSDEEVAALEELLTKAESATDVPSPSEHGPGGSEDVQPATAAEKKEKIP